MGDPTSDVALSRVAFRKTTESHRSGARTLSQEFFVSSSLFERERNEIFRRHWLFVGHQNEIPASGDYFLAEVAGENLIVVRGPDLKIRAFHNTCRHRGTQVCEKLRGHVTALQCPYHAWTYSLTGKLIGAPHMNEESSFEKSQYGLASAELAIWEGLLFIDLSADGPSLEKYFQPLAHKFTRWKLPELSPTREITYEVAANWKLICQNYSECYHCPLVHPALQQLTPYDMAENDLTEGPFLGGFMPVEKGRSVTMSGRSCARSVGDFPASEKEEIFYYSIFPNLLLSLHSDYVMTHRLVPRKPDRTDVICSWYFHPAAGQEHDFNPEDAIAFWDMTNRQDWHVCELSQRGIASSAYQPGPYSPRESIPAAWDREYLRQLPRA